jgi:hypothetical protein
MGKRSNSIKFLTRSWLQRLLAAARERGVRDYAMILLAYRHGLRASEVCRVQTSHIDLDAGNIQNTMIHVPMSSAYVDRAFEAAQAQESVNKSVAYPDAVLYESHPAEFLLVPFIAAKDNFCRFQVQGGNNHLVMLYKEPLREPALQVTVNRPVFEIR